MLPVPRLISKSIVSRGARHPCPQCVLKYSSVTESDEPAETAKKRPVHPFSKLSPVEKQLRSMGLFYNDKSLAHVGGNRSYALLGDLAWLERALVRWALKKLVKQYDFTPVTVPNLIYADILPNCGFPGVFGERSQVYKLQGSGGSKSKATAIDRLIGSDSGRARTICVAGTAEIPLVSMNLGKCFDIESQECEESLPKKYCALSRCYRAETSQREPGLFRVHYFSKVEMVLLVPLNECSKYLQQVVSIQESIFNELGLQTRTVEMSLDREHEVAVSKYDVEAFFPLQNTWGEISSASDCSINQSSKLNIRSRSINTDGDGESGEPFIEQFIGTINGTAIASPRILIALLETHRDAKSKQLLVPPVLINEMGGLKYLRPYKMMPKIP